MASGLPNAACSDCAVKETKSFYHKRDPVEALFGCSCRFAGSFHHLNCCCTHLSRLSVLDFPGKQHQFFQCFKSIIGHELFPLLLSFGLCDFIPLYFGRYGPVLEPLHFSRQIMESLGWGEQQQNPQMLQSRVRVGCKVACISAATVSNSA